MCDEWMPSLRLSMSQEQFYQLPRHPAYRYEFLDGQAFLTPHSRHYHAVLDLAAALPVLRAEPVTDPWVIRPVEPDEVPRLVPLFAAAFRVTQPFGSLDDATRQEAAAQVLERTRTGGDGPWVAPASFVALQSDGGPQPYAGAIFITLLPGGDPIDWESYYWSEPAPSDLLEKRQGWPHLTWIFAAPLESGRGLGTGLLAAAVQELLTLGYTELASTFMAGNDSSMLWHWRSGFRLLPYPGSHRVIRKRWLGRQ